MASVLLVDDEKEVAENLKMFFDLQGITCWVAKESDEALRILEENKPDLVLLDVRLDGSALSGLGILEEAKKMGVSSKIYMVTGYDDAESHAKAQELGADGYLEKPLELEKMLELVKKVAG